MSACLLLGVALAPLGFSHLELGPRVSAAHAAADAPGDASAYGSTHRPARFSPRRAQVTRWTPPLAGDLRVVHDFSPPASPWGPGHRGVDLAGSPGDVVRAAGAGVVVYAGPLAGRGVVSVQHESGLRTTYEPVRARVGAGQHVRAGEALGLLTSAWSHCTPDACLHWGLRNGETYLNPLALLGRLPARLLPVWGVPEPPT